VTVRLNLDLVIVGGAVGAGGRTDVPAQLHTEGTTMFIVEGRTLGVFAALGAVLSMVVVFDRLSDVADSTEPRSPAVFATASVAPFQVICHDDESALSNRSVASTRPSEAVALDENRNSHPLNRLCN
jgi:hypothetical protein